MCAHACSFLLGVHLGVQVPGRVEALRLTVGAARDWLPQGLQHLSLPPRRERALASRVLTHTCSGCLPITTVLVDVQRSLVALVCTDLTTGAAEHLFVCCYLI